MGRRTPKCNDCVCPDGQCPLCNYTGITISGLTSSVCKSGCDDRNGSYVLYRDQVITPGTQTCQFCLAINNDNCSSNDNFPLGYYIGRSGNACYSSGYSALCLAFEIKDGRSHVYAELKMEYNIFGGGPGDGSGAYFRYGWYATTWTASAINCGAGYPPLTLLNNYSWFLPPARYQTQQFMTWCNSLGDPGDVCNVHGATLGIF